MHMANDSYQLKDNRLEWKNKRLGIQKGHTA